MNKLFIPFWAGVSFLLFLYSFTQVDLSLTLSQASIYQDIQKGFQYVGWFERPLSTYLYIGIFTLLFFLYFWTLKLINKEVISRKLVWKSVVVITFILTFSYNAFSYDLFNYIFDAKIVTFYNQNPYFHKALDFPSDPMLSFMRWTHRTYPYGPGWLLLTVPLSYLGGNIFIFTFFLFKILMASFFILTVIFIEKIAKIIKVGSPLLAMASFAFNPFILSESLVSAHNDIVMMGLALVGSYYLLKRKALKGTIFYILSTSIKFATALGLIVYFILVGLRKKNQLITITMFAMITAIILASLRTNFQPWYLLYVAPFAALMFEKVYVKHPFFIFSIAAVIYYIPFLYTGNWNDPIPTILNNIIVIAGVISISTVVAVSAFTKVKNQ